MNRSQFSEFMREHGPCRLHLGPEMVANEGEILDIYAIHIDAPDAAAITVLAGPHERVFEGIAKGYRKYDFGRRYLRTPSIEVQADAPVFVTYQYRVRRNKDESIDST